MTLATVTSFKFGLKVHPSEVGWRTTTVATMETMAMVETVTMETVTMAEVAEMAVVVAEMAVEVEEEAVAVAVEEALAEASLFLC